MRHRLAFYRNESYLRKFDGLLIALHRSYQNLNFDINTNGERRIHEVLTATHPHIIFDIGANKGDWTREIHALHPQAAIFAFEPIEETFKILQQTAPFAQTFHFALGSNNSRITFGKSSESECSSKYSEALGDLNAYEEVDIKCGDEFVREKQITHIDYLKIDAEGMDYEVLLGFKQTIADNKISIIQFEYSKYNIHSKTFLKDFYELLSPDFEIGKIYPTYIDFRPYHDDQEDFLGSNFLAVKPPLVCYFK